MSNYIEYKDSLIAKNSEAYKLWEAKDWKKLDKHLAKLKKEAQARGEIR